MLEERAAMRDVARMLHGGGYLRIITGNRNNSVSET